MGKKRRLMFWLGAILVGCAGIVANIEAAADIDTDTEEAAADIDTNTEEAAADIGIETEEAAADIDTNTDVPELVIWVDADSELVVRNALYSYNEFTQKEERGDYAEASWNLVDKSYLTPEEFQKELLEALDSGAGPDLILMDESNGVSPEYLMDNAYLLVLDNVEEHIPGRQEYLPGTLEAGQRGECQYVLPVYIQCPIVYGMKEELEAAGIDTETGFSSLKEFMETMTEAARSTGKLIFEDETAADWIERCCMTGASQEERDELENMLQELRQYCGANDGFFGSYEALSSGECLLGGNYLSDKFRAAQNVAALEQEGEITFLNIPSWEGNIRGMITLAAAVNANTQYLLEAETLLWEFQRSFVTSALNSDDMAVLGERESWNQQLKDLADWAENSWQIVYGQEREFSSLSSDITSAFRKCTQTAVTDAVFQNGCPSGVEGTQESGEDIPEKDVLTVVVGVGGMGKDHPVYQWLDGVAAKYSDETLSVQLIPVNESQNFVSVEAYKMHMADAGPDILLGGQISLETPFGSDLLGEWYMDLTPFLPEGKELPAAQVLEKTRGLIYGKNADGSQNYIFTVSESSSLKEEAVEFCILALEDEGYSQAIELAGLNAFSDD